MNSWVTALIAYLVKALFEGAFELVGDLSVSITVEDSPCLERRLSKHFGLDLAIKLTSALLDVERVWSPAACCTHDQVASVVLEASDLSWSVHELQMPLLLLFSALFISCEGTEEILALLHLLVSIGMHDLGEIFHEPEVSTHSICKTSELAELWDQGDLITSLPILVDEERLVWVVDVLVVSGLIVLFVADLSSLLVEGGLRAHGVVDPLNTICLLIVPELK